MGSDEGESLELWENVELCFGGKSFVGECCWIDIRVSHSI